MQQHGQLSCRGNDGAFLRVSSTTLGQFQSPAPQIAIRSKWSQNVLCPLHQQRSQIRVAFLLMCICGSLWPEFLRPGCSPR
jgi:hypothetical protein